MIDNAAIFMQSGQSIALERISSVNDNTMRSHFHPYFELFYLEKGKRAVVIGERSYLLGPHEFIIFPPYTMHHSFSDKDVAFARIVLYFEPESIPESVRSWLMQEDKPHSWSTISQQQHFYDQLCGLMQEQEHNDWPDQIAHNENLDKEDLLQLALNSRLNLLLLTIMRSQSKEIPAQSEPKIARIVQYVHNHYYQELSLDELSARFFINKFSLCREFKRFTMCSFVEYLNKIRVLHAQRLFMESDKSITQIASDVGFGNLTHFERVFSKHTQQTPKKMCQQMRQIRDRKEPKESNKRGTVTETATAIDDALSPDYHLDPTKLTSA